MTAIHHGGLTGDALDDALFPRIGYRNLFRDGAVTASSEASGGDVEQAYNGLTYDAWISTGGATQWIEVDMGSPAAAADYMAIAAHTLEGCSITPQYSQNGTDWSGLDTAYTVPDNRPIVFEFGAVTANFFRLLIESAAGAVQVGAIHVGQKLLPERGLAVGWQPPSLNEKIEYTNVMSQGGQLLGRNIIRRGAQAKVSIDPATWLWARDSFGSFRDSAELYAFFLWWALEDRAEIVYGMLGQHSVAFTDHNFVGVDFEVVGINR